MTNCFLWLNKTPIPCGILKNWYIKQVEEVKTQKQKKKALGQEIFCAMNPMGNNRLVKLNELSFEMFSDYLIQLQQKQKQKGVK